MHAGSAKEGMMRKTHKKEWKRPELVALARSKPEEAVLGGCKQTTVLGRVESWRSG
jgi:hypothetical protein